MFWKQVSTFALRMIVAAFAFASTLGAWAGDDDEQAFLVKYRCVVVETLRSIRATPMKTAEDRKRYLIVQWQEEQFGYVQCIFFDWDKQAHCEAASGFYENAKGSSRTRFIVGEALRALVKLGFSPDDSQGNFVKEFPVAGPQDFPAIADFLLSALYEAYHGRGDKGVEIIAPDASQAESEARCRAVS